MVELQIVRDARGDLFENLLSVLWLEDLREAKEADVGKLLDGRRQLAQVGDSEIRCPAEEIGGHEIPTFSVTTQVYF